MFAKDLVSKEIPHLKPSDLVKDALNLMEEYKVSNLALVDQCHYLCLLTENELLNKPDVNKEIGKTCGYAPSVNEDDHFYDALNLISQSHLDLLPVLTNDNQYIGVITLSSTTSVMARLFSVAEEGAIIILEMNPADYVLTDIARLAEDNNIRIINMFTHYDKEIGKLYVTIKIDSKEATPYLRSLERFNYHVIFHFQHMGKVDDDMRKRVEELIYYIEL